MPLNISKGNMYPWVTHTHTHIGGLCHYRCSYCYVDHPRFGRPKKYSGPLQLLSKEFGVCYDKKTLERKGGKYPATIFEGHLIDMWARGVPSDWIRMILNVCNCWPENAYVFQTKNPARYLEHDLLAYIPAKSIFGCTIETNRHIDNTISLAPEPIERYLSMVTVRRILWSMKDFHQTFITIEPVMDFDVVELSRWIIHINPTFVNIGADSKHHYLPEPSADKVRTLIEKLAAAGIEIREKHNLERILKS